LNAHAVGLASTAFRRFADIPGKWQFNRLRRPKLSCVTGFVLICGAGEGSPNIQRLNAWLIERDFAPILDLAGPHAVGSKHPEIDVYVAGYNYFPEDEFIELFLSLRWYVPEVCVLVLTPQEGAARIIRSDTEPLDI
jgi:hypothetical protein